jgi:hypothetical protein
VAVIIYYGRLAANAEYCNMLGGLGEMPSNDGK